MGMGGAGGVSGQTCGFCCMLCRSMHSAMRDGKAILHTENPLTVVIFSVPTIKKDPSQVRCWPG